MSAVTAASCIFKYSPRVSQSRKNNEKKNTHKANSDDMQQIAVKRRVLASLYHTARIASSCQITVAVLALLLSHFKCWVKRLTLQFTGCQRLLSFAHRCRSILWRPNNNIGFILHLVSCGNKLLMRSRFRCMSVLLPLLDWQFQLLVDRKCPQPKMRRWPIAHNCLLIKLCSRTLRL